ncbi:hypothetical protein Taro_007320 [Colocasia esculenta]|uniref:Uncharacterized protein n=1 Tax=Colocasia esculenta TaxID=4460 RepID=A0A843TYM2_COLES|nr:hypothetical protein [Colocasia esculenta]
MEQHPTISNRRREQARAWLDRVNVEVDLPHQNEGGMGAADIATTSNHHLDQGQPVENPNIRVPSSSNLEIVMQENQKLKAMLESLMQQLGMAAPLPPQQSPPQASQPALPTTAPALGNLPPDIPCTEPLAEQPIENPNSSHGETQEVHVTKQRHDAPQLNTLFEETMVSQRAMIEQIIEAKMAEQNKGSATCIGGKTPKDENTRSREVNVVDFSATLGKAGGKGDTSASSNSKKEERRSTPTLNERLNTPYSFTREHTKELLDICLQENLMTLPEPKRPEEAAMVDKPNYCPYHRVLGHTLENCYLFKNRVEKLIQAGIIDMAEHLVNPQKPHQQPKLTFSANVIHVMAQARSQ